jgi:hypothetical protein
VSGSVASGRSDECELTGSEMMAELRRMVSLLNEVLSQHILDPKAGSRKDPRWILYTHPETDAEFPIISFTQTGMSFSELGHGGVARVLKTEVADEYLSGDGTNSIFQLARFPVYQIESVEYPIGNKLQWIDEYAEEDYTIGKFKTRDIPIIGVDNIKVNYTYALDSSLQTGFTNTMTYQVTVWSRRGDTFTVTDPHYAISKVHMSGSKLCDYVAEQVVDAIMENRDYIRTQGITKANIAGFSQANYDPETKLYVKNLTFEFIVDTLYNNDAVASNKIAQIQGNIDSKYNQNIIIP